MSAHNPNLRFARPALLLGGFLVAVASLMAELRVIDVSKLQAASQVVGPSTPTVGGTPVYASGTGGGLDTWVLAAVGFSLLLALVILARKRRLTGGEHLLWRTLGMILGLAIYPAVLLLISATGAPLAGLQQALILGTALISFAVLAVVAAVLVVMTLRERSGSFRLSASLRRESVLRNVRKLLESMRGTVYSARQSEVNRDLVIACYSSMKDLLAVYGARDRPSYTPREFQRSASGGLRVSQQNIDSLTHLFEKARYADSAVTSADAMDSISALERLTDELEVSWPRG